MWSSTLGLQVQACLHYSSVLDNSPWFLCKWLTNFFPVIINNILLCIDFLILLDKDEVRMFQILKVCLPLKSSYPFNILLRNFPSEISNS